MKYEKYTGRSYYKFNKVNSHGHTESIYMMTSLHLNHFRKYCLGHFIFMLIICSESSGNNLFWKERAIRIPSQVIHRIIPRVNRICSACAFVNLAFHTYRRSKSRGFTRFITFINEIQGLFNISQHILTLPWQRMFRYEIRETVDEWCNIKGKSCNRRMFHCHTKGEGPCEQERADTSSGCAETTKSAFEKEKRSWLGECTWDREVRDRLRVNIRGGDNKKNSEVEG